MAEQTGTGYLDLIQGNRNFRMLWFGQIVSLFGDWFNLIASAALVAQLTQSGLAVGLLFAVRMLAPFLISPLAGVAADRYNRKTLLILTDLTRAVTVLAFLFIREPQHAWLLFALTAVQLGISGVFFPTRTAMLPDLVTESELGAANALTATTWSVLLAVGSAAGGLVAGTLGIYASFVVDSFTFLLSAALIWQIAYRRPEVQGSEGASLREAIQEYVDGLRYLRKNLDVLVLVLQKAGMSFTIAGGAANVVMVTLSEQVYVIGESGAISLGIIFGVVGAGTGVGPILARKFTGDRELPMRRTIALSYGVSVLGLLLAAQLISFGSVLLGMFLRAFGIGAIWVFSTQLLLQKVSSEVRGRVFATDFALFTLGSATSAWIGGWVLDSTGLAVGQVMLWMAGLGLIPWLVWIVYWRFQTSD
jgi:MFS family permease